MGVMSPDVQDSDEQLCHSLFQCYLYLLRYFVGVMSPDVQDSDEQLSPFVSVLAVFADVFCGSYVP